MKKRSLTKAQGYALALLLIMAIFYAYIHFVYDPAKRNLDQLNVRINLTQAEITSLGDPPDVREAQSKAEAAAGNLAQLQFELSHVEATRKATMQPTVTKAMALINQLAVQNQLDVKHLLFMERVMEAGADAALAGRQRRVRRNAGQDRQEEEVITAADHFQWDRYTIVFTGSHSGIVTFMGDLSEAFWLVLINELEISLSESDGNDRQNDEQNEEEQEYELALEIML